MISAAISRPVQLIAAFGILLAILLGFVFFVVLPFHNAIEDAQAGIVEQRELIGRFRSLTATPEDIRKRAEEREQAIRSGIFLEGDTDAVRSARLLALLTDAAKKEGITVRSTRGLPNRDRDGIRTVAAQAEFLAELPQLQSVLVRIENMRPYLFVQSLDISPVISRKSNGGLLEVRLSIFGAIAPTGG